MMGLQEETHERKDKMTRTQKILWTIVGIELICLYALAVGWIV